jgi:hypothetical protein
MRPAEPVAIPHLGCAVAAEQQQEHEHVALRALERDAVLHVVFSVLGSKAWVMLAGVNRQWRDLYAAMTDSKQTSVQHAVASLATYEYAKVCGREFTARDGHLLGQYAGLDVLASGAIAESPLSIVVDAAFESGRPDMLQVLQLLDPVVNHRGPDYFVNTVYKSINCSIICSAAEYGQLECLRFLTQAAAATGAAASRAYHVQEDERWAVSRAAATGGHVPTLQWLQQQSFLHEHSASSLCSLAAAQGCMEAVIWLHEQGFKLGASACRGAARAGHLQLLQWLRAHGAQWEPDTMQVAGAAGGSVAVLQFLQEQAVGQWDPAAVTRLLSVAGRHGQLAAAQWLYAAGGELPGSMWDVDVCWLHLCTLQWAVEQEGVPWGESPPQNTCYWLLDQMAEEVWEWAHEHGCPCNCGDALPIHAGEH